MCILIYHPDKTIHDVNFATGCCLHNITHHITQRCDDIVVLK
jgi:hypothetical protein